MRSMQPLYRSGPFDKTNAEVNITLHTDFRLQRGGGGGGGGGGGVDGWVGPEIPGIL